MWNYNSHVNDRWDHIVDDEQIICDILEGHIRSRVWPNHCSRCGISLDAECYQALLIALPWSREFRYYEREIKYGKI